MKEISVGIDLGTTNSTISTCWPEGQPRLIRDETGSGIIPSVISFTENNEITVGFKAKQRMLTDLENTFYSIKRFIGRDMRKDEIAWAASQYPFKIESGQNGIPLAVTRGKKIPVYQLSGYVLKYLKEMAEESTGQEVKKAVITVPANFNESQRKATKQAGEFAGLDVIRIFNEPTAAALAYGLGKKEKEIVAIYDFGGGTFDITILRLEDPVFEVLSTAGETMLGGDDFDRLILNDMLAQFQDQYGFNPAEDTRLVQRFLFGAERMKCQLSDWIVTAFEDRHIKGPDGNPLKPFHYELNREKFKKITIKIAERSFEVCNEALRLARLKVENIDKVVLVGGTTRIPYLKKMIEDFFHKPPLDKIQPDVVVSIGAAIQAFSLIGGEEIYQVEEADLVPTTFYHKSDLQKLGIDLKSTKSEEAKAPPAKSATFTPDNILPALKTEKQPQEISFPSNTIEGVPPAVLPSTQKGQKLSPVPQFASKSSENIELLPDKKQTMNEMEQTHTYSQKSPLQLNSEELESLDHLLKEEEEEEVEEVPDIIPIKTPSIPISAIIPPPETKAESVASSPPTVTPESLGQQYIPGDVLKQIEKMQSEFPAGAPEGAIASAGISITGQEKTIEEKPRKPLTAPVLLDVTPSTLGVATVGGFMEILIKKNTPIPVEKSHIFTTSTDNQEKVVVRILEGESTIADENNEIGVIELLDIRPAPRGEVKIEVKFDISVDGILEISAKNLETQTEQKARLTLFGT